MALLTVSIQIRKQIKKKILTIQFCLRDYKIKKISIENT